MVDINDYKMIYRLKIKGITKKWIFVLLIITIGLIIINKSFKYEKYYSSQSEIKDNYLVIYVNIEEIKQITKNYELKIENKKFAYKIKSISKENIYLNGNYYKEIKLSIEKHKLQENDVVNIKIITDEYSIIEYIFKTVWR